MSRCVCPKISAQKYDELVQLFVNDKDWDLLKLQDMYNAGNSLDNIVEAVPFRSDECTRTDKCCGVCTRRCHSRCIQDCLNRLYMWRRMAEATPADQYEQIPLAIRMIVEQDFETLYDLSWCVGEIISRESNATLKKYMKEHEMHPAENPYKLDYAPRYDLDERTGKRKIDPNGKIQILKWPKSGLCPFCLPKVTVDRSVFRRGSKYNARHTKETV